MKKFFLHGGPLSNFKRIILHWTGGGLKANPTDIKAYHRIVEYGGVVVNGKYSPEDNLNCYDGAYAAHIGGANTGSML